MHASKKIYDIVHGAIITSYTSVVVHAEVNAIMFKTCVSLEGCTLYTTLFPCNECAKVVIEAGIRTICYLTGDKDTTKRYFKASKNLLGIAGYEPFSKDTSMSGPASDFPPRRLKRRASDSTLLQAESPTKRQKINSLRK